MERIKGLRRDVLSLIRTLYKTLGELTTELEAPEPAPVDRNEKMSTWTRGRPTEPGYYWRFWRGNLELVLIYHNYYSLNNKGPLVIEHLEELGDQWQRVEPPTPPEV